MDKIILNGCRFYGYHGAFAEEQTLGQIFVSAIPEPCNTVVNYSSKNVM